MDRFFESLLIVLFKFIWIIVQSIEEEEERERESENLKFTLLKKSLLCFSCWKHIVKCVTCLLMLY